MQEIFCKKKGALKNFVKFTEKYLCQSFFFNKVVECIIFLRMEQKNKFWALSNESTYVTDQLKKLDIDFYDNIKLPISVF